MLFVPKCWIPNLYISIWVWQRIYWNKQLNHFWKLDLRPKTANILDKTIPRTNPLTQGQLDLPQSQDNYFRKIKDWKRHWVISEHHILAFSAPKTLRQSFPKDPRWAPTMSNIPTPQTFAASLSVHAFGRTLDACSWIAHACSLPSPHV